jgi:hypothetical protein
MRWSPGEEILKSGGQALNHFIRYLAARGNPCNFSYFALLSETVPCFCVPDPGRRFVQRADTRR